MQFLVEQPNFPQKPPTCNTGGMELTTQQKGEIAHLKVQLMAIKKGLILSKPLIDSRYDFILDDGKERKRVQVKYSDSPASHCVGAIRVQLEKAHKNTSLVYSLDEIDLVLAYLPKKDVIIALPAEKFNGKRAVQIRLEESKNQQKTGVNFYKDFVW